MRRRHFVEMDDEWQQRWEQALRETEAELPELIDRGWKLKAAAEEHSLSGQLRRAVHRSSLTLPEIIDRVGVSAAEFSDFLVGTQSLPSEKIDRLAELLGYELVPAHAADDQS